ncbi:hypothetical protein SCP_1701290 [Sparassis crispa]|uniref:Sds3-like-domain-containing protein n=1 Tax=Sparassis crispa TaxID=139825 RepID=A0A401H5V2_9APHY|nr:hypothetical protein SCP_1701290 [Sparassis crispa]GBE89804.1 hypothetical protein SCP_1701290 [Sparassis crispa]
MPGTSVSLDSLSSPSLSPPPPDEHQTSTSNSGAACLDMDSGSELSELTEEEQENEGRENGSRTGDSGNSSSRDSRTKRGIVPPPMWEWAKNNKKGGDWRTRLIEEEEEEELPGPAKAMEEEEDEDLDARDRDRDREDGREELPGPAHRRLDRLPTPRTPPYPRPSPDRDGGPAYDSESVADEEEEDDEAEHEATPDAAPELTDDEGEGEGGDEDDSAEKTALPAEGDESEGEDAGAEDVEMQQDAEPATVDSVTPVEAGALMDVDEPSPPIPVAPAGLSIMAGSTVIEPISSSSTSPSGSPSSSRSPSPEAEAEQDAHSEHEPEAEEVLPEAKTPGGRTSRTRKAKARTRAARKAKVEAGDVDMDHTGALDMDEVDGDGVEAEEAEVDSAELELELDLDLQPAHRAEALDVLATIELKFALLRERLYVEKMEGLAWEENLVAEGTHPEMLHLHTELSKRRDKRLELASRRRDYEVSNVTKRRKLDEDAVWSWWQFVRDDLQTEMISETNRKRRRLERERRAMERPQPARRIPSAPIDAPPPPTLREIVKNHPYNSLSSSAPHSHRPRSYASATPLVYPQLTVLSQPEALADCDFLNQHRRAAAGFDPHRPMQMNTVLGSAPHAYEPYNIGMLDSPGTGNRFGPPPLFPHHALPHSQIQGPGITQGFPVHGGRPPHPTFHPSQVLDQDMNSVHAPGSINMQGGSHVQQYPILGGPANLMRRSISPVPVQSLNSGPGLGMSIGISAPPLPPGLSGSKSNGWDLSGHSLFPGGSKEARRPNGDIDGRERERERERYGDSFKLRDREKTEREREFELERERERERERDPDRMYHMQMLQQQQHSVHQHPHQHVHAAPGQASHHQLGPHHHHHHHHHVHHHHPQPSAGPSGHSSPIAGLSTPAMGPVQGQREFETRRPHSGAPPEVIELPVSGSKQSPLMSSLWKGPDDPLSSSADIGRERGRPLGPPAAIMQAKFPGSPRNGPGPPTAPPSIAPSRRGSWSASEESGLARPASASAGPSASGRSRDGSVHRNSTSRVQRPPSTQPPQNLFAGSPRNNGRQLPPPAMSHLNSTAAFTAPLRSPRSNPPLLPPPPQTTPASSSTAHSPSIRPTTPKTESPRAHRHSPSSPGQTKAPSRTASSNAEPNFNAPPGATSSMAPSINIVNMKSSESLSLFPTSSALPNPPLPPPPRLSNGGMSERHSPRLGGSLAPKIVPVDGS